MHIEMTTFFGLILIQTYNQHKTHCVSQRNRRHKADIHKQETQLMIYSLVIIIFSQRCEYTNSAAKEKSIGHDQTVKVKCCIKIPLLCMRSAPKIWLGFVVLNICACCRCQILIGSRNIFEVTKYINAKRR